MPEDRVSFLLIFSDIKCEQMINTSDGYDLLAAKQEIPKDILRYFIFYFICPTRLSTLRRYLYHIRYLPLALQLPLGYLPDLLVAALPPPLCLAWRRHLRRLHWDRS